MGFDEQNDDILRGIKTWIDFIFARRLSIAICYLLIETQTNERKLWSEHTRENGDWKLDHCITRCGGRSRPWRCQFHLLLYVAIFFSVFCFHWNCYEWKLVISKVFCLSSVCFFAVFSSSFNKIQPPNKIHIWVSNPVVDWVRIVCV